MKKEKIYKSLIPEFFSADHTRRKKILNKIENSLNYSNYTFQKYYKCYRKIFFKVSIFLVFLYIIGTLLFFFFSFFDAEVIYLGFIYFICSLLGITFVIINKKINFSRNSSFIFLRYGNFILIYIVILLLYLFLFNKNIKQQNYTFNDVEEFITGKSTNENSTINFINFKNITLNHLKISDNILNLEFSFLIQHDKDILESNLVDFIRKNLKNSFDQFFLFDKNFRIFIETFNFNKKIYNDPSFYNSLFLIIFYIFLFIFSINQMIMIIFCISNFIVNILFLRYDNLNDFFFMILRNFFLCILFYSLLSEKSESFSANNKLNFFLKIIIKNNLKFLKIIEDKSIILKNKNKKIVLNNYFEQEFNQKLNTTNSQPSSINLEKNKISKLSKTFSLEHYSNQKNDSLKNLKLNNLNNKNELRRKFSLFSLGHNKKDSLSLKRNNTNIEKIQTYLNASGIAHSYLKNKNSQISNIHNLFDFSKFNEEIFANNYKFLNYKIISKQSSLKFCIQNFKNNNLNELDILKLFIEFHFDNSESEKTINLDSLFSQSSMTRTIYYSQRLTNKFDNFDKNEYNKSDKSLYHKINSSLLNDFIEEKSSLEREKKTNKKTNENFSNEVFIGHYFDLDTLSLDLNRKSNDFKKDEEYPKIYSVYLTFINKQEFIKDKFHNKKYENYYSKKNSINLNNKKEKLIILNSQSNNNPNNLENINHQKNLNFINNNDSEINFFGKQDFNSSLHKSNLQNNNFNNCNLTEEIKDNYNNVNEKINYNININNKIEVYDINIIQKLKIKKNNICKNICCFFRNMRKNIKEKENENDVFENNKINDSFSNRDKILQKKSNTIKSKFYNSKSCLQIRNLNDNKSLPIEFSNDKTKILNKIVNKKLYQNYYQVLIFREISQDIIINYYECKKTKDKQISKIIHELKTPLNSIIGVTVNMIENYNIINQFENINLLKDLSRYTTFLINDITQSLNTQLLDIYGVNLCEVSVSTIIDFCYNILKALLKCYDLKVDKILPIIEMDKNLENFTYISDEIRLKQIILNFISNSVKFTKRGSITIKTRIVDDITEYNSNHKQIGESEKNEIKSRKKKINCPNKGKRLEISVIDTGIGIEEKNHSVLFSHENIMLNQTYAKNQNQFGSGLGLNIVNNLAKLMDHEILFYSKIGEGSTFSVFINCKENTNITYNNINHGGSSNIKLYHNSEGEKQESNKMIANRCSKISSKHMFERMITRKASNIQGLEYFNNNLNLQRIKTRDFDCITSKKIDDIKFNFDTDNFSQSIDITEKFSQFQKKSNINFIMNRRETMGSRPKSTYRLETNDSIQFIYPFNFDKSENITGELLDMEITKKLFNIKNLNQEPYNLSLIDKTNDSGMIYFVKQPSPVKKNYQENKNNYPKIVLVDDQKYIRQSSKNLLIHALEKKRLIYEILEGSDGMDILNYVIEDCKNENLIRIIITDENMEFINGTTAIEVIKLLERTNKIKNYLKICVISSNDDPIQRRLFYTKGADYVLEKPCSIDVFIKILDDLNKGN